MTVIPEASLGTMSALQAVEVVLTQAGTPLSLPELTRRVLESGHWQSEGQTPDATISARLSTDIQQRGAASRFQRTGKGVFALRAWGLPEYEVPVRSARTASHDTPPAPEPAPLSKDSPDQPVATLPTLPAPRGMSFTTAAERVLERCADKRPMHYRAITEQALALGLIHTAGQTPEATMYAQILTEIDRQTKRGETPRFVRHGRGLVGLSRWQGRGLSGQIERHNTEVRRNLLGRLKAMPPEKFETLIGELLAKMGFDEVIVTSRSGDGGIDVRGTLVVGDVIRTHMAVQVKRWKNNVQAPDVQRVRGALGAHDQGLIITTSDFSRGARDEAARADAVPVGLMHGDQLVALLVEHSVGIHRTTHDLIELGESEAD